MMGLRIIPLELDQANDVVRALHRHHFATVGHRYSLGVALDGKLVGAAIVGRPVSRGCDPRRVVEVTRCVTDGTKNACSALYAACARAAAAIGYERIQTYTLSSEPGTSLRAAGWLLDRHTAGGQWRHDDDELQRRTDQPTDPKACWVKILNRPLGDIEYPHTESVEHASLFDLLPDADIDGSPAVESPV